MPSRVENYLAHLDRLSDGIEPTFRRVESTKPGLQSVTVMIYKDLPEPGHLTALTYGLSLAEHPDWRSGSPELCTSVRSTDIAWALADYLPRDYAEVVRSPTATPSTSVSPLPLNQA
jgi:hypothetical protein